MQMGRLQGLQMRAQRKWPKRIQCWLNSILFSV
uniref:Uncharacterized protein n=1 Tax=Arundo donax TaxID=35708 RepID=A0A0A9BCF4_ARUDO